MTCTRGSDGSDGKVIVGLEGVEVKESKATR